MWVKVFHYIEKQFKIDKWVETVIEEANTQMDLVLLPITDFELFLIIYKVVSVLTH